MRSVFQSTERLLIRLFKPAVVLFCILWILLELLFPASAAIFLSKKYMAQVVACDTAMENEWYFRESSADPRASSIELLNCHDYDETRKLMLVSGLPEEYLSWLGLRALDIHQRPTDQVNEAHKFINR